MDGGVIPPPPPVNVQLNNHAVQPTLLVHLLPHAHSRASGGSSSTSAVSPPPAIPPTPETPSATTTPAAAPRLTETRRQLKQLTFLLSGSTFLALSILTTRRTLAKRRLALIPPFYHPNNRPPLVPPNGALDAFQALNLATLNTMAFAIFLVGGSMVALDVCSVDELRERARKSVVGEEELAKEREAEEEFEEWLASVLARKERKEEIRRRVKEDMEREKAGEGV